MQDVQDGTIRHISSDVLPFDIHNSPNSDIVATEAQVHNYEQPKHSSDSAITIFCNPVVITISTCTNPLPITEKLICFNYDLQSYKCFFQFCQTMDFWAWYRINLHMENGTKFYHRTVSIPSISFSKRKRLFYQPATSIRHPPNT